MKGSPWFAYAWKILREHCMIPQRTSKTTKTPAIEPQENSSNLKSILNFVLFLFFLWKRAAKRYDLFNLTVENCIYQTPKQHNLNERNHLVDNLLNNQI